MMNGVGVTMPGVEEDGGQNWEWLRSNAPSRAGTEEYRYKKEEN